MSDNYFYSTLKHVILYNIKLSNTYIQVKKPAYIGSPIQMMMIKEQNI